MPLLREEDSSRLRASLRAVLPAVGTLVFLLAGSILLRAILEAAGVDGPFGEILAASVAQAVLYLALVGAAILMASRLEGRGFATFGLDVDLDWSRSFVAGVAVGVLGIAASLWWADLRGLRDVDLAAGGASGPGGPVVVAGAFGLFVVYFLLGNVYEEVVYRRIVLGNFLEGLVARGWSTPAAAVVATAGSLALFGLFHVPLRGNLVVAVDAALLGIPFALAYLLTGRLALPVGVHFGRVTTEFAHGMTRGEFEVRAVVELTRNAPAANLEYKLLQVGVTCLLVLAWARLDRGDLGLAEPFR